MNIIITQLVLISILQVARSQSQELNMIHLGHKNSFSMPGVELC